MLCFFLLASFPGDRRGYSYCRLMVLARVSVRIFYFLPWPTLRPITRLAVPTIPSSSPPPPFLSASHHDSCVWTACASLRMRHAARLAGRGAAWSFSSQLMKSHFGLKASESKFELWRVSLQTNKDEHRSATQHSHSTKVMFARSANIAFAKLRNEAFRTNTRTPDMFCTFHTQDVYAGLRPAQHRGRCIR